MHRSVRESLAGVGRWPRLLAGTACLLLAVVSALGAAHRSGSAHTPEGTVAVVVAARTLPAGRQLAPRDLALQRWPPSLSPPGGARRVSARVGRRLAGPLRAGEPVTDTRMIGSALTDGLDPGLAAVPVSLPDPHAAELIRPGEHVELLATANDDLGLYGTDATIGTGTTGTGTTGTGTTGTGTTGTGTTDTGAPPDPVTVVARRLLVLAVLPGRQDVSTSLVVAADPTTTIAIARAQSVGVFLAVPVSP